MNQLTVEQNTMQGPLVILREDAIQTLEDIATMLVSLPGEAEEDSRRLRDIVEDLQQMFFIVAIIGEFNAGKSTFINAMLGERLLPTGITPTTEYIELVRYSPTPQRVPTLRQNSVRECGTPWYRR